MQHLPMYTTFHTEDGGDCVYSYLKQDESYHNVHKFSDTLNLAIFWSFRLFTQVMVHAKSANVWLVDYINSQIHKIAKFYTC